MRITFLSLLLLLLFGCQPGVASERLAVGEFPPSNAGWDLDGNPVSLEDFRDRVVVVSFWASWCPPCRVELEVMERIQSQVAVDELRIIAANVRERDQRAVRSAIAGFEDRQLLYTFDRRDRVSRTFGIKHLPRMMILDRQGRVAHLHTGYDEAFLDQIVDELNALLNAQ